jgi:hypothetical protein
LLAITIEHVEQPRQRAPAQPSGVDARRQAHFVTPGTNLPSSICAGV